MPFGRYEVLDKDKVDTAIQAQYSKRLLELRALGFDEEFYIRETLYPLSAIVRFNVLIQAYFRASVFRLGGMFQLISFNPYLIHGDGYTYSAIWETGIRYVTLFDDNTLLTTTNYQSLVTSDPQLRFIRQVCLIRTNSLAQTWQMHAERVIQLVQDRSTMGPLHAGDVVGLETRIDEMIIKGYPRKWNITVN
jgi:hypothetical protein